MSTPEYKCHSSTHFKQLSCPSYSQCCSKTVEDVLFPFLPYLDSTKYFQKLPTKYMWICDYFLHCKFGWKSQIKLFFAFSLFYMNLLLYMDQNPWQWKIWQVLQLSYSNRCLISEMKKLLFIFFANQKYSSSKEFKFWYASQKFQDKKVALKIPPWLWQKICSTLLHLK